MLNNLFSVAICIGCGCDDNHACWDEQTDNPCHWLRLDREAGLGVCSVCAESVDRWDLGGREVAVPRMPSLLANPLL